jgi:hypothetical protein
VMCVRMAVVSNVEREQQMPSAMRERYGNTDPLVHSQKMIMAFQGSPKDGKDIAFFGMQVLEYPDTTALEHYKKCAYVAYIESIPVYHLDSCDVHRSDDIDACCSSPAECNRQRSAVTREIFLGYLRYLQLRKFR